MVSHSSIHDSTTTPKTVILAPKRADRGGLVEQVERLMEQTAVLSISPCGCSTAEFLGLPYYGKECMFAPGKEALTTREYARIDQEGNLIVHPTYIFPGEEGWLGSGWAARVMDNQNPLTDRQDFYTGFVYGKNVQNGSFVSTTDAMGKDYVIVSHRSHIVPAIHIDFENLAILQQLFTERELRDSDIEYVCIGSNNSGFPRRIEIPPLQGVDLNSLIELVKGNVRTNDPDNGLEKELNLLLELQRHSRGFYVPSGIESGASQPHPHDRVVSLPILPKWVKDCYESAEQHASINGDSFYDFLKKSGFVIEEYDRFVLATDPVPDLSGGLLILSKSKHNIVEMGKDELRELGRMRKIGRVLQEIAYGGIPSNDYAVQTFDRHVATYPNTRFTMYLVPRKNVPAFLELGTKISGIDTNPRILAAQMIDLKQYLNGYII